jgi:hypothetical protein
MTEKLPPEAARLATLHPFTPARPTGLFKTAAAFCDEFEPLSYVMGTVVRSSSLYTLTARTGEGKTAFLVTAAFSVAADRSDLIGMDVEPGRVAYLAGENPDDIRMRLMTAAYAANIDLRHIGDRLVVLDHRSRPEDIATELKRMAEEEPFALIVMDTLAAYFDGKDINDNVQGGEFIRRLRPLVQIVGRPAMLIAAHPIKNAKPDQLIPYGSGAMLNEVDGNLTLSKQAPGVTGLHWEGKLRGVEFPAHLFRFEPLSSPSVIDKQGRQVLIPLLKPTTAVDLEQRQEAQVNVRVALLKAMIAEPKGSILAWTTAVGLKSKSTTHGHLVRLAKENLVDKALDRYFVTPKGRKAIEAA